MDKITEIKTLLNRIQNTEGPHFEYDEAAILKEYEDRLKNKSSISMKVLSIFGGFLASIAFLIFLIILGLYDSEVGLLFFGGMIIISTLIINRIYNHILTDTFSISLFLLGLGLFIIGLAQLNWHENNIVVFISLIALISLFVSQSFLLQFTSILVFNGSILFLIYNEYHDFIHFYIVLNSIFLTFLYLNEAKIIAAKNLFSNLYHPLRIGTLFSLIIGFVLIGKMNLLPINPNFVWLSSIILGMLSYYLVSIILKINEVYTVKNKIVIYFFTTCLFIPTLFAPSISGAIFIILLNFLVNYKTGFYIGIIAGIYFISQYYYDLNFTLLSKSISLIIFGIVFILFYFFTIYKSNKDAKI